MPRIGVRVMVFNSNFHGSQFKHNIMYREGSSGRFDVTIGPKQNMGKTVSTHVVVTI
jgi:hypothetical protein